MNDPSLDKVPAANTPPPSPEAALHMHMDNLVTGAFAHYEALPSRSHRDANEMVPERTVETHNYRDGTQRQFITDERDGSVESKLYLSHAVVDPYGRRVLLVTKTYVDGRVERDLRFLPSSRQNENTYRWSADQPVSEVLTNNETRPLQPGSPEFIQAWNLGRQVAGRLQRLYEYQRPSGSIRVAKAGAALVGTLVRLATRSRS